MRRQRPLLKPWPHRGKLAKSGANSGLAAKIIPVVAHLAVVVGLYMVGLLHFSDRRQGVAMAHCIC
ncbi:MAG: hypothetical protein Ct9H300mP1_24530 [Planctomycetaceae bacterium]|nr:MAG: hypothetical protein Ct9H300mP1_24530 [Planctomycetaceae bacterium]